MPELRSGFVRASGYADKLRRVAFAQLGKKLDPKVIVRDVGELNQHIFKEFQRHNVQKNYVVRIIAPYKIERADGNEKIVWDYKNLEFEVYIPAIMVKGEDSWLIQPTEKEQFEATYEEYAEAHGGSEIGEE